MLLWQLANKSLHLYISFYLICFLTVQVTVLVIILTTLSQTVAKVKLSSTKTLFCLNSNAVFNSHNLLWWAQIKIKARWRC